LIKSFFNRWKRFAQIEARAILAAGRLVPSGLAECNRLLPIAALAVLDLELHSTGHRLRVRVFGQILWSTTPLAPLGDLVPT
jgi:hypothetical protein